MTPPAPPPIDGRTAETIAADVQKRIASYTGWKPGASPDPGQALVRIFAHFADIIVERLNRTPDKAFLAFLDLIGVSQLPPEPARVPLTFHLAQGAALDARVPAGTPVAAAALEGEADPPVFETTGELFLTGAELIAAHALDPARDAWRDLSVLAGPAAPAASVPGLPVFSGDRPIERRLWIADPLLAGQGARDVTVTISTRPTDPDFPDLEWGRWDGTSWQPMTPSIVRSSGVARLTFAGLQPLPAAQAVSANGARSAIRGAWIGGRLPHRDLSDERLALPPHWVMSLTINASVSRDNLVPDGVFSGSVAIDASKDFLPFGERPKLGDVFLISCNEAFTVAGPVNAAHPHTIILRLTASDLDQGRLPPPDPVTHDDGNVTLAWEYWNRNHWRPIGQSNQALPSVADGADSSLQFSDGTRAFMAMTRAGSAAVTFRRPDDWTPSLVGGQSGYWLRVRIAGGGYGHDATYRLQAGTDTNGKPLQGYVLDPATWRAPSLRAISCGYKYTSPAVIPEHVLVEGNFVLADRTPALTAEDAPGLALFPPGEDTAPALYFGFRRPGAAAAFANQPVTLFVGVDEVSYQHLKDAGPLKPAKQAAVAWEYRSAAGWRWLGAQDETAGLMRSGLVTFIAPADLVQTVAFGQAACWLRARWDGGDYVVAPRLNRLVTNTLWANQATTIANEVLGSGTSEPEQIFSTSKTPVLGGQRVEVRELEPPTAADRAALEAEEGPDCIISADDDPANPSEVWVRWHGVQDFYASAPTSRHYTIDRLSGVITFGGGGRGRHPPSGSNNIRISYQSGGGAVGNRPAGNITRMKSAVAYVDSVTNLMAAAGGADAQGLDVVRQRGPTMLRHQGRAIAVADYEDLAYDASPAVARTKGLPARSAADAGGVELLVVPRGGERQPLPSLELLRQVQDHLVRLAPPTVDLMVRGPDWLALSVTVEVVPVSLDRAMDVRTAVRDGLTAFLHPLTGGPDGQGWDFGRSPHQSDFYALIGAIAGVDHVRALTLTTPSDAPPIGEATLIYAGEINVVLVAHATNE